MHKPIPVPTRKIEGTHTLVAGYGYLTGMGLGQDKITHGLPVSLLYASTRVTFHFVLRHSHHLSVIPVIPVTSPSPLSLYLTYRSLSSIIVSPSFVFRLFLRYRSIPPLSCSEHHFSDLWLHYLTLTSSHSCGWTISLLSSWSYDLIT